MKAYLKANSTSVTHFALLLITLLATVVLYKSIELSYTIEHHINELMVKQPVIGKAFAEYDIDGKLFVSCIKSSPVVSHDNTTRCLAEAASLKK